MKWKVAIVAVVGIVLLSMAPAPTLAERGTVTIDGRIDVDIHTPSPVKRALDDEITHELEKGLIDDDSRERENTRKERERWERQKRGEYWDEDGRVR
ncbi:MAG: hypothetical protein ABSF52_10060 [Syntrophobacteraceae bacterium]|jgi:hypothetical protein